MLSSNAHEITCRARARKNRNNISSTFPLVIYPTNPIQDHNQNHTRQTPIDARNFSNGTFGRALVMISAIMSDDGQCCTLTSFEATRSRVKW